MTAGSSGIAREVVPLARPIAVFAVLMTTAVVVRADPAPAAVAPFRLPGIGRPSPHLLLDRQRLEGLAEAVTSIRTSFFSAWKHLERRCEAGLAYPPRGYGGDDPAVFYKICSREAGLARDLALGYRLSGREAYGTRAALLLEDWARERAGKRLNSEKDFPSGGMKAARATFPFLWAYDLLATTRLLDEKERRAAETWFGRLADFIRHDFQAWVENDYFNRQDYQNHLAAHMTTLRAIGLVTDEENLVQYALDSEENPRDLRELIAGCILMPGDTPHHREPRAWQMEAGEIYDRYRHHTGHLRGLQYCHLTLKLLALSAQMCEQHGLDLFEYTAPGGENLRLPFEFYADFYRLRDASLHHGLYSGESHRIGKAGDIPGMFELGLRHYPDSRPLRALIRSIDRAGQYGRLLGYPVFFARIE